MELTAVAETIVCRSALSNTLYPYRPLPYENLSDSLSTNCSATDAFVAVALTNAPEAKVTFADALLELAAEPLIVPDSVVV